MFLAGVLDAWPALAEPVLATRTRASRGARGIDRGARAAVASPRRASSFDGKRCTPTGRYVAFRRTDRRGADLGVGAATTRSSILRLLAEAEAAVHRVPIERVHFHELADWDTQADLVGAAMAIDLLDGASWHCRPLPLGSGTVRSAHGPLPLPAPAAAKLLAGLRLSRR